jgi:hypothetical protein
MREEGKKGRREEGKKGRRKEGKKERREEGRQGSREGGVQLTPQSLINSVIRKNTNPFEKLLESNYQMASIISPEVNQS